MNPEPAAGFLPFARKARGDAPSNAARCKVTGTGLSLAALKTAPEAALWEAHRLALEGWAADPAPP
ncbi:MAG: hypothetical protein JKY65_23490, partial [Planctomycetes bacterium]|nr:hypothetical protein [Planctomycetota bacterium]